MTSVIFCARETGLMRTIPAIVSAIRARYTDSNRDGQLDPWCSAGSVDAGAMPMLPRVLSARSR